METGSVALSQVVTEEQLVERSEAFENAVTGRDRASLQASWFDAGVQPEQRLPPLQPWRGRRCCCCSY